MMRYDTFPDENAGLMYNFITSSNLCINIFHTNIIMVACCCYIPLIHMLRSDMIGNENVCLNTAKKRNKK